MKRVLLVTTSNKPTQSLRSLNEFIEALNAESTDVIFTACTVQQLLFTVHDGVIGITLDGMELHTAFDVFHLRNVNLYPDYVNAARIYADMHGIELINRADMVLPYYGKVSQGFLLASKGITTPSFVSSPSNELLKQSLLELNWGYPLVIKHNDGIKGLDNHLVHSPEEAQTVLSKDKQGYLVQPFIANGGELRVLTFGEDMAPLIFKKQAAPGEYLNNTSRGGSSTPIDPQSVEPGVLRQALRAAKLMGRDIAGVDVLLGNDRHFYILEVNVTPAIYDGVMPAEKRGLYMQYLNSYELEEE